MSRLNAAIHSPGNTQKPLGYGADCSSGNRGRFIRCSDGRAKFFVREGKDGSPRNRASVIHGRSIDRMSDDRIVRLLVTIVVRAVAIIGAVGSGLSS